MAKRAFDAQVAALESLRRAPGATAREQLRKTLQARNNYLVARAAAITADLRFDDLIPELVAAYDRFFVEPARSDPHCLAKQALAAALQRLGHNDADAFVRGITHVQFEPAWGGRADTAAGLRGTCARALTDCFLDDLEILRYLTDTLADPDKTVRIDAAIALDQLNRSESALLLRLRLLIGDPEADVMGQCCTSLLSLGFDDAVAFVGRLLHHADTDVQLEAASALAQCRHAEALSVLRDFWGGEFPTTDIRRAILIGLGASPLPESAEFLLAAIATEPQTLAETAVTALSTSRFAMESRARAAEAVAARGSPALQKHFEARFGGSLLR